MDQEKVTLPPTEIVDPAGREFDRAPVALQLERLLASQAHAVEAIRKITDHLASAVSATDRLRANNGRLVYAGAGCSIRIGVQDGVELVPTFGWPLNRLVYLIAGIRRRLLNLLRGLRMMSMMRLSRSNNGVSLRQMWSLVLRHRGTHHSPVRSSRLDQRAGRFDRRCEFESAGRLVAVAEHSLVTETGAEVLAGSTRLGAGTAQKALLNAFSTSLMTQLGRVLGNEMLCVQATNAKLKSRQARILASQIDGFDQSRAYQLLRELNWDLRTGLLVASGGIDEMPKKLSPMSVLFVSYYYAPDD